MFRKRFNERLAESEATYKTDPDRYEGPDWWQLSEEEKEVFAIRRDRWPRMMEAWVAYEAFKKITTEFYDDADVDEARANNPDWCGESIDPTEFDKFAKKLAGLGFRESHAMYAKYDFWCVRNGITYYHDERTDDASREGS